jgi:hypothetical protein
MGIDQAGHDQMTGCVENLVGSGRRKIRANGDDFTTADEDVGNRRLMHVARVVVDLAAAK